MDEARGLYIIDKHGEFRSKIEDVEFNPNKQLNTQARAASIWNTLYRNNMTNIIESQDKFKEYYKSIFKK